MHDKNSPASLRSDGDRFRRNTRIIKVAIAQLAAAYRTVAALREDGTNLFAGLPATWEKSRFAKGRSVGDRKFVHVFDDVKDHFADRRADLTYMMASEDSIGLDHWLDELGQMIRTYAALNNVSVPDLAPGHCSRGARLPGPIDNFANPLYRG